MRLEEGLPVSACSFVPQIMHVPKVAHADMSPVAAFFGLFMFLRAVIITWRLLAFSLRQILPTARFARYLPSPQHQATFNG